jgi:hypothetical protein
VYTGCNFDRASPHFLHFQRRQRAEWLAQWRATRTNTSGNSGGGDSDKVAAIVADLEEAIMIVEEEMKPYLGRQLSWERLDAMVASLQSSVFSLQSSVFSHQSSALGASLSVLGYL